MRVLLVINGLGFGGAERIVEALAIGLQHSGHEVAVVATTRGGPIAERLKAKNIPVSVLHLAKPWSPHWAAEGAAIVRHFRPEVVHSHLAFADMAGAIIRKASSPAAHVVTLHNAGPHLQSFEQRLWQRALRASDRRISVSVSVQKRVLRRLGLDSEVQHPTLLPTRPRRRSRAEARRALGLPESGKLVLSVGRYSPVKGLDVLGAAAKTLASPDVHVAAMGCGPEAAKIQGYGPLISLSARADAAELLTAADVFVNCSRREGFSQSILEAMSAEVPVVATAVGGNPELVISGETGLLVPPDDPAALSEALRSLLETPAYARQLAAKAKRHIHDQNLFRSGMVARTQDVYRQVSPSG